MNYYGNIDPERSEFPCIFSRHLYSAIFTSWGYQCAYCKSMPAKVVDHIICKRRGGLDDVANYAAACVSCNREKWTYLLRPDLLEIIQTLAYFKAPSICHEKDRRCRKKFRRRWQDPFHNRLLPYMAENVVSLISLPLSVKAMRQAVDLDPRHPGSCTFLGGLRRKGIEIPPGELATELLAGSGRDGPTVYSRYQARSLVTSITWMSGGGIEADFESDFFTAVSAAHAGKLNLLEVDGDGNILPQRNNRFRPLASHRLLPPTEPPHPVLKQVGWLQK